FQNPLFQKNQKKISRVGRSSSQSNKQLPPPSPSSLPSSVLKSIQKGAFWKAIPSLKTFLKAHPRHKEGRFFYLQSLLFAREKEQAKKFFSAVKDLAKWKQDMLRAHLLLNAYPSEDLAKIESLIKQTSLKIADPEILHKKNFKAYYLYLQGTFWQQKKDFQKAMDCYKEALKLLPQHHIYLNNVFYLFFSRLNLYQQAYQFCLSQEEHFSNSFLLHLLRGTVLLKLGRFPQAEKALRRAYLLSQNINNKNTLRMKGWMLQIYYSYGKSLVFLKQYSQARKFFRMCKAAYSSYKLSAYYWIAQTYFREGKPGLAVKELEASIKAGPAIGNFQQLAVGYLMLKKVSSAIKVLEMGLRHFPKSEDLLLLLGEVYFQLHNVSMAKNCFEKAYI
ncbi:MAG: tetratricopeptide repeat protein, partial [Planctomycetota bacterium]